MPFKNDYVTEVVTEQDEPGGLRRQVLGGDVPPELEAIGIISLVFRSWMDYETNPDDYFWEGTTDTGNVVRGYANGGTVFQQMRNSASGIGIDNTVGFYYTQPSLYTLNTAPVNVRQGRGHIASDKITASINFTNAGFTTIIRINGAADFFANGAQANRVWKVSIHGGVSNTVAGPNNDFRMRVWRGGVVVGSPEFYRYYSGNLPSNVDGARYVSIDSASNAARDFEIIATSSVVSTGSAFATATLPFIMTIEDVGTLDSGQWGAVITSV